MRLLIRLGFLLLLSIFVQAAEVNISLNPQVAQVGDTLQLLLQIKGALSQTVQYPRELPEPFEILQTDTSQLHRSGYLRYTIAAYDTGRHTLTELPVVIGNGVTLDTLRTQPVSVLIHSVITDSAGPLKPIKPYREHPFRWRELVSYLWIPGVLILLGALWWVWRKYFSKKTKSVSIPPELRLPAHEVAVRELIALKDKNYPARGMFKEFFSEFSQIIRKYLERRYEFPALEMTTFELEREFQTPHFPEIWSTRLLPALREADLVKFAKFIPDLQDAQRFLELGFELIAQTKPQEIPEETLEEKAA